MAGHPRVDGGPMLATASDPAALAPANTIAVARPAGRSSVLCKSRLPGRPTRVVALIITILFVSVADLILSLTFLTTVGMAEANPLARMVFASNSVGLVVAFKLGLSGVACLFLWLARKTPTGECGAWLGALLMVWLLVRWDVYIEESHVFTTVLNAPAPHHHHDSQWVAIVD